MIFLFHSIPFLFSVFPLAGLVAAVKYIAPILFSVVIGILMRPQPTSNVRYVEKTDDPPPPPPIDNPPDIDPPNRCKPVPRRIYRDPPPDQEPPPPPPKRILPPKPLPPSGTSSNTESNPQSIIKESLADHVFGCLLARPFYEQGQDFCVYENTTFSEFYDTLKADMEAERSAIEAEIEDGKTGHALRLAPALISLDAVTQPAFIVGTKQIHKIATYYSKRSYFGNNFEITGLISLGETTISDCSAIVEYQDEPKFDNDDAECMIPLSAYDEIEGYKADQLQIIWRNLDWKTDKKRKYFTIPQPNDIDTFDIDGLKGLLPSTFTFGATVIEIWLKIENIDDSIRPIQKTVVMTNHQTSDEIKNFVYGEFKAWLEAVTTKVTIKEYIAKFLDDSDIYVGACKPYRAVYMGWDKEKTKWFKKADWYLFDK